jgi:hypothetical protein
MYHLFFQRNKSFSIFHLKKKSRSTFLRIMFDSTSSRLIESWRSTFSFFLSCFIDAFSTKDRIRCANESNCWRINNTMRNFKNEALNVAFLLETFFIHFRDARFSLSATFSKRSIFEILSISRDNDLKDFFFFKILSTIATIFSFFKKFYAFLTIENSAQFAESLFAKQLLFDISSTVSNVFDAMLFAFDKNTCRLLIDEKKYFFFLFSFLFLKMLWVHLNSWHATSSLWTTLMLELNDEWFLIKSYLKILYRCFSSHFTYWISRSHATRSIHHIVIKCH